jgi:hypothetical protein
MKTKAVCFLVAGCLLAVPAWLVHVPSPTPQGVDPPPKPAEAKDKYSPTVQKGLGYLVNNQHADGHWEGDGGKHPVAMTGLVGLALLMDGETDVKWIVAPPATKTKRSTNVNKAADWLMNQSRPGRDGLIFSDHPSETARYMEGHGLATLFLAGACQEEADGARRKKLTDVLIKAVKYIAKAQSNQGGWYHTSKMEGHDFDVVSVTVIQIQAIRAADNAGVPLPREVIKDAKAYLKTAIEKHEIREKAGANFSRSIDTAAALAACNSSNEIETLPRMKWFGYCEAQFPIGRDIKFGRDELIHYYYAQAYTHGGDWSDYRTALFDQLQRSQEKDGSWPAGDGISVGPVYSTALWCTVLQLDNRNHPSMRRGNLIIE